MKPTAEPKQPFPYSEQAHAVQFYTEDNFLLDGLCEFVTDALTEGGSVVLVVTKKHRNGLMKRLRACGPDVTSAMKKERVLVVDAAETLSKFMDGDSPNQRRFVSVIGSLIRKAESSGEARNKPVAVFGEMVALLWAEKKFEASIRLEQLWNELSKTYMFYLRCAYPVGGLHGKQKGEPYAAVCAEHSHVIPAEDFA